jgi:predicted O-methyltransferase YrrM
VGVIRLRDRGAFYRSRLLRELAAVAKWPAIRNTAPDIAHLAFYREQSSGPVPRDEALFLHALLRVLRPETAVEIGFLQGDNAFNLLRALDADARLYSFDIDPACAEVAQRRFGHDARFTYRTRAQEALQPADLDGRVADFVFLDGAHDLVLNQRAFERLLSLMAPTALLAVHDTGAVPGAFIPDGHAARQLMDQWVDDEFEHQPDERAFVNWLLEQNPEFSQIHVHSRRVVRHGLTLLQRSAPLNRPANWTPRNGQNTAWKPDLREFGADPR